MMFLGNDVWSAHQLSFNVQGMVDTLKASYPLIINDNNHSHVILNVDRSCLGSPTKVGYGGVLRNEACFYLSGFSSYIHHTSDILYAKLFTIYQGLLLAKEKGIVDLVCYSGSLLCINIIIGPLMRFHTYVVLIQDIKELMEQINATINHILRKGN